MNGVLVYGYFFAEMNFASFINTSVFAGYYTCHRGVRLSLVVALGGLSKVSTGLWVLVITGGFSLAAVGAGAANIVARRAIEPGNFLERRILINVTLHFERSHSLAQQLTLLI